MSSGDGPGSLNQIETQVDSFQDIADLITEAEENPAAGLSYLNEVDRENRDDYTRIETEYRGIGP